MNKKYIPIVILGCIVLLRVVFHIGTFLTTTTATGTVGAMVPPATAQAENHAHEYVEVERASDFGSRETTIKKECPCGKTETEVVAIPTNEMAEYLKANCKTYTYEEIARSPDEHKGELAVFTGEVMQVQEVLGTTTLLVNITKEGDEYYTYYTDAVYVDYEFTDELKILEDDIITMYGVLQGEQSYKTVLGQYVTVPLVEIYYAELNK